MAGSATGVPMVRVMDDQVSRHDKTCASCRVCHADSNAPSGHAQSSRDHALAGSAAGVPMVRTMDDQKPKLWKTMATSRTEETISQGAWRAYEQRLLMAGSGENLDGNFDRQDMVRDTTHWKNPKLRPSLRPCYLIKPYT